MALPDPRRLAALDMYGTRGRQRRRWLIRAEFAAGACGCGLIGVLTLARGSGGWVALGAWLVGVGANYVPLFVESQRLSRPGALEVELAGLDTTRELRAAAKAQLWIAVPFAVCLAALTQSLGKRR